MTKKNDEHPHEIVPGGDDGWLRIAAVTMFITVAASAITGNYYLVALVGIFWLGYVTFCLVWEEKQNG